jgi:PAS domain S-box-containing protein
MPHPLRSVSPSLRSQLLVLAVLSAAPFIALAALRGVELGKRERAHGLEQALGAARSVRVRIDERLASYESALKTIAAAVGLDGSTRDAMDVHLRSLRASLPREFRWIALWNAAGEILGTSEEPSAGEERPRVDGEVWFLQAAATARLAHGISARAEWRDLLILALSKQGFVVSAAVDKDALDALLDASLPGSFSVALLDAKGVVLARSADSRSWRGRDLSATLAFQAARQTREGSKELADAGGTERLVGYSTANTGWIVEVGVPSSIALAAARQRLLVDLGLGTAALGVVFSLALFMTQRISRPIQQLAADAEELGAGNLGHRTQVRSAGELGTLAETFNNMALTLERSTAALRKSEERLRLLVESAPDQAFFLLGPDGRVSSWNAGAQRLYDFPEADVVGSPFARLFAPEDARARKPELLLETARKDGSSEVETWQVRQRGNRFRARVALTAQREDAGEVHSFCVVARDDGMRLELEMRTRQAQRIDAVGRLAGSVAHEFNNLFTKICGYTELVRTGVKPAEPWRSYLREISQLCREAGRLTRDLLSFSRRKDGSPKILDLNEVVRHLEQVLRRALGGQVALEVRLAPELGNVTADAREIEQILTNLASNAGEAMPSGGACRIETRNAEPGEIGPAAPPGTKPPAYVVLSITDTGVGMDGETRARVFEPFFTTKAGQTGRGLGLSVVYDTVARSGGTIAVESEPGKGSTFRVYLPQAEREAFAPRPPEAEPALGPRGSETILLVEDEEGVRHLIRSVLVQSGYQVLDAAAGPAALEAARRHNGPLHLLLTDVGLPGMKGPELARELRRVRPEIPILYMSGYVGDAIRDFGFLESEPALLQKPFEWSELLSRVRQTLESGAAAPRPETTS